MRTLARFLFKIIALALVVMLAVFLWTDVRDHFGQTPGMLETTRLSRELREMGLLTSMQYVDTGVFVATVPALLIGTAQRVSAPYEYTIDFGVDLEKTDIRAIDEGLLEVTIPPAQMLRDQLRVTGKATVFDVFYPLTEARYQQILDEQTLALRQEFLDDPSHLTAAHEVATTKVRTLLEALLKAQGAQDEWSIVFATPTQVQTDTEPQAL